MVAGVRPRTANQLHAWLRAALDVEAPRHAWEAEEGRPRDGPLAYLCHAFFEEGAAAARSRDAVVWACRGGGKTFYAAVATLLDLVFKPGIEVRLIGGSLEQSQRMHGHLRRLFERPAVRAMVDGRMTARRVALVNGSVAEVCAQSETSVRGVRPQKLRCDEVELFDPEVWAAALLAPRSRRCGAVWAHAAVEALSTMHRPAGLMASVVARAGEGCAGPAPRLFRWGVAEVLSRCEAGRACEGCGLWEECGGRAKRGDGHVVIDDALAMKGRSGEASWRAEMLCERPLMRDAVLPEFERGVHVVGGDSLEGVWVGGMDFGFADPTVFLLARMDGEGVVRVVDEMVAREATLERVIERVRAVCARRGAPEEGPAWIGADPAGHQRSGHSGVSAVTALKRAGMRVRTRRMGVEEGLGLLRARLAPASGGPRLFVHERCAGLIAAMEAYRYERKGGSAAPRKEGPDHWVDALRYLVVNLERGWGGMVSYL